jgi:hypothetical protein
VDAGELCRIMSADRRLGDEVSAQVAELVRLRVERDREIRSGFSDSVNEAFGGAVESLQLRFAWRVFDTAREPETRAEALATLQAVLAAEIDEHLGKEVGDDSFSDRFRPTYNLPSMRDRIAFHRLHYIEPMAALPGLSPRMRHLLAELARVDVELARAARGRGDPELSGQAQNRYAFLHDDLMVLGLPYPAGARLYRDALAVMERDLEQALVANRALLARLLS